MELCGKYIPREIILEIMAKDMTIYAPFMLSSGTAYRLLNNNKRFRQTYGQPKSRYSKHDAIKKIQNMINQCRQKDIKFTWEISLRADKWALIITYDSDGRKDLTMRTRQTIQLNMLWLWKGLLPHERELIFSS